MELNLRLVEMLIVVAEEGSMNRAATRLNLTQQAVSSQVTMLERVVGDRLLARTPRGVTLTPSGSVVVERGRALLRAADQMSTEVRAVVEGRTNRLRVVFKAQSTAHFLPQVVRTLERQARHVQIDMIVVSTVGEEIDALLDGSADAAFAWLPVAEERLTSVTVLSEPLLVVLPLDHPLADRETVTFADLAGEPTIGPHSVPREIARAWTVDPRPDGSSPVLGPEVRTHEAGLLQVAAGRGICFLPASVTEYFARPDLAWIPVRDADPFELAVVWPLGRGGPLLDSLVSSCERLTARSSAPVD